MSKKVSLEEFNGVKRGEKIPETIRKQLEKEIKELLFTNGFDFNKSELSRKYKVTPKVIYTIIHEICDTAKHIDYEAMQILRLEKNRQLLLEELNTLRSKDRPRSHILRELRDTEKEIADQRRKAGMSENKEVFNLDSKVEYIVKVLEGNDNGNKSDSKRLE